MHTLFSLKQADIPTHWYNILADIPEPLPPPLHPGTRQPIGPEDMAAIFPDNLVAQEMTAERWVEIPAAVREIYGLWRPTPLYRALRLEKELQTPAHIYYKYEGVSPAGVTSQILRLHKLITTRPAALSDSRPKLERASGVRLWPLPVVCSIWIAASTW